MNSRFRIYRNALSLASLWVYLSMTMVAIGDLIPAKVVEDTSPGNGVACDIYRYRAGKVVAWVGKTREDGTGELPDSGKEGEEFRPVSIHYASVTVAHCPVKPPGPAEMKVHKTQRPGDIANAFESVDPAVAAYFFLLDSDATGDPQLKLVSRKKTFELMGKYFDVSKPFEVNKFQVVPSTSLTKSVEAFQRKSGLASSGELDQETLTAVVKEHLPELPTESKSKQELMLLLNKN